MSQGQPTDLAAALWRAYPELDAVATAAGEPVYVVGGAVRDLLLGRGRADLDLVVVGDASVLAAKLGAEPVAHERFGTAKVELDGHAIDIAGARTETYAHPGALPEVAPAPEIEADLGRRDFSVNAIAILVAEEAALIDPYGGRADLESGLLRILHAQSFVDDPTRAIRAARYAARLGFEPEPETARLLRATELGTVSAERREAELLRLAGEDSGPAGLALLGDWDLVDLRPEGVELAAAVAELLAAAPWSRFASEELGPDARARAVLAAAIGPAAEETVPAADPGRPSLGVELAAGNSAVELILARALGATWLDDYVGEWRTVGLEIDGADLIAAGVAEGPDIGRGLATAKRRKLDGEISGREQELAVALAAARGGSA
jgi:tRNA nucleotidyltransferase (CCA-adding enzyme)